MSIRSGDAFEERGCVQSISRSSSELLRLGFTTAALRTRITASTAIHPIPQAWSNGPVVHVVGDDLAAAALEDDLRVRRMDHVRVGLHLFQPDLGLQPAKITRVVLAVCPKGLSRFGRFLAVLTKMERFRLRIPAASSLHLQLA